MIQINQLTKDFGQKKGIFDLNFSIKEQEVFGFLGPNGAGKTTTIRHLLGFLNADGGNCSINGKDCRTKASEIMETVGYLPGENVLINAMTGSQFFQFIMSLRRRKNMALCKQLIERFELDPHTKIKKMSKGMKQKVAVVSAFMHNPQILILDEPTSGLDPLMQLEFTKLIAEEKTKGKTILMSSHHFEEVEKNCDTIGIIKQGKMVFIEDIQSIKQKKRKNYTLTFASKEDMTRFTQTTTFHFDNMNTNSVDVKAVDNFDALIKEINHFHMIDIQSEVYTLENLFMHYYGGNKA